MKDLTAESVPTGDADYMGEIDRLIGQIEQMQRELKHSRERTEHIRLQTRANFEAIEASLNRLAAH